MMEFLLWRMERLRTLAMDATRMMDKTPITEAVMEMEMEMEVKMEVAVAEMAAVVDQSESTQAVQCISKLTCGAQH